MIELVEWLAGAVAIVGVLFRIRLWRGGPLQPGARYLAAFTVCLGLAMALLPFSWTSGIADRPLVRYLLPLLCTELKLAAECFLALTALAVRNGDRSRPLMRRQALGSVLVMAAVAVLYRAAGVTPVAGRITVEAAGRAELAGYNVLFTTHSLWCVGLFTLLIHRSARRLAPGLLRTGLRLVVVAGVCGLYWSVMSLIPLVEGLRTGRQTSGANLHSAAIGLATLVMVIGGMTATAWGGRIAGWVRRLRARRDLRRIGPLWEALYAVRPEIALEPPSARGRRGPAGDPEFALYRRVIEIRDGQLALRAHLHAEVPGWASTACAAARLDRRRTDATVEAAVLAAALEAAAAGRRYPYPGTGGHTPPATTADLRTESAQLVLVAEAFTHSPIVAAVRRRVRTEPAALQSEG
ncbi:MAB_1171c family putative transporter [Kitasatospora sp. NPDC051853]|uniref:MAB_1171c family putative transporter n=1 Tax=Kitasatospora sp. NPDC051853 TaxID=3364058 RepID=UPI0037B8DA24